MVKVYISFTIDDMEWRNALVGQKDNFRSPINFTQFIIKRPWLSSWKASCSKRIKSCAGMIGIITPNTLKAYGQLWELKCAIDEDLPLLLMHGANEPEHTVKQTPEVINGKQIKLWNEESVVDFLNRLERQSEGKSTCP